MTAARHAWVQQKLEPFEKSEREELPPPEWRLQAVWEAVPQGGAVTAEAVSEATGKGVAEVLALLMELELSGWVRRYPGPSFGRAGTR